MRDFFREHSWPVLVSVLLHGLLVAALIIAAWMSTRRAPPSVQPLPVDAVVVDSQVLHAAQRLQHDRADAQARAEAQAQAQALAAAKAHDDSQAAEEAKTAQAARDADQAKVTAAAADAAKVAAAEQQRMADAQKAAEADKAAKVQHRVEAEKSAAAARQADDTKRAEDAKRVAEAKQAAETKQAAEAKRAVEAKQAADAKQADAKRAADDKARQDREAELRRQLADEEHTSAVESGPLRDRYITLLRNKIQNAWIKPPSARVGTDCLVAVTQVPGGEVTSAHVTQCNGDAAVRQSIENAVYRASPLPDPPDPALFERNFVFRFRPNE
jgi:colicin import membrane protein